MNEARKLYDVIDTKTGEVFTGSATEIASRTNVDAEFIRLCARKKRRLERRYDIVFHPLVYKVTLPYGKVKIAKTRAELEDIFGYTVVAIEGEMRKNGNGMAYGCLVEKVAA